MLQCCRLLPILLAAIHPPISDVPSISYAQVSRHREWFLGAMQMVAREREASVYKTASEGAALETQRDAASASQRNAEVVAKECEVRRQ